MGATNWKNISSHYQARWYWPLSHKLSNPRRTQFVYTPQQNRMAAVKVWFPPFSMNTFSKANGLELLTTPEKPTQTTTNLPLPIFDRSALILKRGGKTRTQLWWNLETPGQHAIERQSWKNAMVEVDTIFSKTQFQNIFATTCSFLSAFATKTSSVIVGHFLRRFHTLPLPWKWENNGKQETNLITEKNNYKNKRSNH